ncbi:MULTISPECIES: hypothetical protein [unclassified Streptomyces]|uniref:hypothetical protein n=1 Tax=unclassified Streptomyces TaxID=2593676 RepID=UPI00131F3B4D|nr:hypothetical protein [Streptomyces sp. 303MFCol5.2]
MRFSAGHPVVCLPALDPDDATQLAATAAKLRDAYQAFRLPGPASDSLETT